MKKIGNRAVASVAVAAVSLLAAAGAAHAAIDVTAVTTGIDDAKTAITTVGGALIGLAVVVMTYRWIKGFVAGG